MTRNGNRVTISRHPVFSNHSETTGTRSQRRGTIHRRQVSKTSSGCSVTTESKHWTNRCLVSTGSNRRETIYFRPKTNHGSSLSSSSTVAHASLDRWLRVHIGLLFLSVFVSWLYGYSSFEENFDVDTTDKQYVRYETLREKYLNDK